MPSEIKSRVFNTEQRQLLDRAWTLAQSLVAEAFRLDFHDLGSWPVDIKLYSELAPEEMAEKVFAQLLRYHRPGAVVWGERPVYYRICLYDPVILVALDQEPELDLEALLTYILTHEFIHVARFAKFMELFDLDDPRRRLEEEVVHQETSRLLHPVVRKGLGLVLELYKDHRLPMD